MERAVSQPKIVRIPTRALRSYERLFVYGIFACGRRLTPEDIPRLFTPQDEGHYPRLSMLAHHMVPARDEQWLLKASVTDVAIDETDADVHRYHLAVSVWRYWRHIHGTLRLRPKAQDIAYVCGVLYL